MATFGPTIQSYHATLEMLDNPLPDGGFWQFAWKAEPVTRAEFRAHIIAAMLLEHMPDDYQVPEGL